MLIIILMATATGNVSDRKQDVRVLVCDGVEEDSPPCDAG